MLLVVWLAPSFEGLNSPTWRKDSTLQVVTPEYLNPLYEGVKHKSSQSYNCKKTPRGQQCFPTKNYWRLVHGWIQITVNSINCSKREILWRGPSFCCVKSIGFLHVSWRCCGLGPKSCNPPQKGCLLRHANKKSSQRDNFDIVWSCFIKSVNIQWGQ